MKKITIILAVLMLVLVILEEIFNVALPFELNKWNGVFLAILVIISGFQNNQDSSLMKNN